MSGFDVAGLLPNPLASNVAVSLVFSTGHYDISLTNVTYDAPAVSLTSMVDGMHMTAQILNFGGDLSAIGGEWYAPNVYGTLTISYITIDADIILSVDPATHGLVATMQNVVVDVATPQVNLSGLIGALVEGLVQNMMADFVTD